MEENKERGVRTILLQFLETKDIAQAIEDLDVIFES